MIASKSRTYTTRDSQAQIVRQDHGFTFLSGRRYGGVKVFERGVQSVVVCRPVSCRWSDVGLVCGRHATLADPTVFHAAGVNAQKPRRGKPTGASEGD